MSLKPVNSEEVLKALDAKTPNGQGERWARSIDIDPLQLRAIKCGRRMMNQKVAMALGFELRWVRVKQ